MRHFDLAIVGRRIGSLALAALAVRRGLTVVILGQNDGGAAYEIAGVQCPSEVNLCGWLGSPAWKAILHDLGLPGTDNRDLDRPSLHLIGEGVRMDLWRDVERLVRDYERQFGPAPHHGRAFYAAIAQLTESTDHALANLRAWPPQNFFEAAWIAWLLRRHGVSEQASSDILLKAWPDAHLYRRAVQFSAEWGTAADWPLPAALVARAHAAALQAPYVPLAAIEQRLLTWLESHGALLLLDVATTHLEQTSSGYLLRGASTGSGPIGAGTIATDLSGELLAHLADGRALRPAAQERWPLVTRGRGRFVTNLLLDARALPIPMVSPSLGIDNVGEMLIIPRRHQEELLLTTVHHVVEGASLTDERERVVSRLEALLPFLREHIQWVHSPHDGLTLSMTSDSNLRPRNPSGTRPMHRSWRIQSPSEKQTWWRGEPVKGPLVQSLLVGPSVFPALGIEGELLAAWKALSTILRRDRRRQRARRSMGAPKVR